MTACCLCSGTHTARNCPTLDLATRRELAREVTAPTCGTSNGARQHRRRGERPCDACRLAWSAYSRQWRAQRRAA